MYSADYPKRLSQFNSTDKYQRELRLLHRILDLKPGSKVLDYGCGIGTAIKYLSPFCEVRGYDVHDFLASDIPDYRKDKGDERFDRIFFMHSLAHIPNVGDVIKHLIKDRLLTTGKIIAITPNKIWLREKNGGVDKKSDSTVIEHFTQQTLQTLFMDAGLRCLTGEFCSGERLYCVATT